MSSSKLGFFSSSSALTSSFFCSPPEVCACSGCFSMKLCSPLVTKSRGLSPSRLLRTPLVSQMAVRRSVHSVIYSASAKVTSSSTAARYSRMFVSMRMKVREVSVPRRASLSARFQKNTGGRNTSLSHTALVSVQSIQLGRGRFLE